MTLTRSHHRRALMMIAGAVTWVVVSNTLSEQRIVVSDDAPCLAGDEVDGPFSAFCQAEIINTHTLVAAGGKTYALLGQESPLRETAMTSRSCSPRCSPRSSRSVSPRWRWCSVRFSW